MLLLAYLRHACLNLLIIFGTMMETTTSGFCTVGGSDLKNVTVVRSDVRGVKRSWLSSICMDELGRGFLEHVSVWVEDV